MINIKENEELNILNHSCAHVLAQAVKRLYPGALFWVGPVIDSGFYYDIDLGTTILSESDLPSIEKEMKVISKEDKRITRIEISKEEALEQFKDDPYKLDLINNLPDDSIITMYRQNEFVDLCRGPHVETTKSVKYFKLLKISGAYFKGDSNNKQLTRIYGICFQTQEDLDTYLKNLELAKQRDHKKLGKQLNLFMTSEFGQGMPFYLPNGTIMRDALENYWKKIHTQHGYKFVKTPIMLNKELWLTSGHWDNYKSNMYTTQVEDKEFAIKPMNCPGAIIIYKENQHSYRELPIRYAELGLVHRIEASGALNGLFRVREFTQDDSHTFITENQIESEVKDIISIVDEIYGRFGLTYKIYLSTRPEDHYIGTIESWDYAETSLKNALTNIGKTYKINEGDGAFYGPKIDIVINDSLDREWQCATIQLDTNLPERFDLSYTDNNGEPVRPLLIHRVIFGSVDRFLAILTEHFGGLFPLFLSPEQVRVIPVNIKYHEKYAKKVLDKLTLKGFRASADFSEESLGYKIRKATIEKIPLFVVIGDKEIENKTVNIRKHGSNEEHIMTLSEFIKIYSKEL